MPKCGECWVDVDTSDRYCKMCGKPLPRERAEEAPNAESEEVTGPRQYQPEGQPRTERQTLVQRVQSVCPPAEVHDQWAMISGGIALIVFALIFLLNGFWLAFLVGLGLGIWLLVQSAKHARATAA